MSVPFYYQTGNHFSRTLKDDIKRVRQNKPARYQSVKVKEQRTSTDGKTHEVSVVRDADALPPTPRQRHELAHGRRY